MAQNIVEKCLIKKDYQLKKTGLSGQVNLIKTIRNIINSYNITNVVTYRL